MNTTKPKSSTDGTASNVELTAQIEGEKPTGGASARIARDEAVVVNKNKRSDHENCG